MIRNSQASHVLSCMSARLQWTVDGQGTARAQEHVAVGFGSELVAILRLQMVARIVWAMQATHATCEFAQVRLACITRV